MFKSTMLIVLAVAAFTVSGCATGTSMHETPGAMSSPATGTCGASQLQSLVGGPSKAAIKLDIPDSSRHYGSEERVATNTPSRLNFVHSGTAVESVIDPNSTILRVFCG